MFNSLQQIFNGYGYTVAPLGVQPTNAQTTFPTEWHEKYFRHSLYRNDPIFDFANQSFRRGGREAFERGRDVMSLI